MCLHAYPWTERIPVEYLEYKIFEEFRLRESTGEKDTHWTRQKATGNS